MTKFAIEVYNALGTMGIGGLNSIGFEFEGSDPDSILCQMAAQTFKFSDWALSLPLQPHH